LTCASLDEDRFGVVQRDIPKILEALLSYLTAIEDFQAEVRAKLPPSEDDQLSPAELDERMRLQVQVEKAEEIINVVGEGTE
jgi:nucleoporin NDC1